MHAHSHSPSPLWSSLGWSPPCKLILCAGRAGHTGGVRRVAVIMRAWMNAPGSLRPASVRTSLARSLRRPSSSFALRYWKIAPALERTEQRAQAKIDFLMASYKKGLYKVYVCMRLCCEFGGVPDPHFAKTRVRVFARSGYNFKYACFWLHNHTHITRPRWSVPIRERTLQQYTELPILIDTNIEYAMLYRSAHSN